MADCRRFISNQQLDIRHILAEAQHRWLKPNEVCEILRNHKMFQIQPDPPYKPTGGSMFLFDRKALRYFRKDGHSWRKKKDGKTVREAHEKLKAGSVDVLHCYYAHGEDNDNFQRRSYWMLDSQLEHIVLVHYREIKEGNRSSTSCSDARAESGSSQTCSPSISAKVDSSSRAVQASYPSSPSTGNCNGQTPYSELLADVDSREDLRSSTLAETADTSTSYGWPNISSQMEDRTGFSNSLRHQFGTGFGGMCSTDMSNPPVQSDILSFSRNISIKQEQGVATCQPSTADFITRKLTDAKLDACSLPEDDGKNMLPNTQVQELLGCSRILQEPLTSPNGAQADFGTSENHVESMINGYGKAPVEADSHNDNSGELKKLDSFGRWMNKEIGGDCGDSLMASDSGNFWNAIDTQDDKEVSSLSRHMQLDINSLGPSLSQEQLFSFSDFSPDWAYSGVETKVLITGSFLGDSNRSRNTAWSCMYGEVEVPAEVITDNVLRCQAPLHAPGRVPFYITCSNRLACSEVREFEYREKPSSEMSLAVVSEPEDEMRLLIRLTKLLCLRLNREWLDCSVENCEKCNLKNEILITRSEDDGEWERLKKCSMVIEQNHENPKDILIEKLLKDKLYEWLVCSVHEEGKGPNILDDEGQGIIHLAAALGYEWAIGPIVAAGVNPNFRDVNGRTGLHWAAFYGREETVVALVRLGAAPGAVEDPTSKFPGGRTAADLASNRGHKGIAGYLAEADLTTHLSLLTLKESVMESVNATIAAEKAVEKIEEQNIISSDGSRDGQLSLKGSLAAVRKSAEAAALIQASFRARSFQFRQLTKSSAEVCASSDVVALASLSNKARKMGHFSDYLHGAALKIQQKYRGWKGRKEFIKIRNRIVKIQAHVRGHQVRKQYKKVIWSVSIVEKAILRWRRKGVGLRGFRAGGASGNSLPLTGKHDEYDFLRLGRKQKVAGVEKALSRVQSMVRYPEAREQYMRLATNFQTSKIDREVRGDQNFDKSATDEDLLALASMTC